MPDVKWIATSLVSLVVVIIVIATVAVPVIEDQAGGATVSGKNTGYSARYTDMTDQRFTFIINPDGSAYYHSGRYDDGGTQYTSPAASPNLVVGDSIIIRSGGSGYFFYALNEGEVFVVTSSVINAPAVVEYLGNSEWVAWIGNDGQEAIFASEGAAGTGNKILLSTTDGSIGLFENKAVNVTLGNAVYAGAYSVSEYGPIRMAKFTDGTKTGDVFSPFTWTNYNQSTGTATTVAAEVSYSVSYEVTGETQQIGKYTGLTTTYGSSTSTYCAIYAPIDYTSTSAGEDSGGTNSVLLGIVPVMLFIVAVMMAVRVLQQAR